MSSRSLPPPPLLLLLLLVCSMSTVQSCLHCSPAFADVLNRFSEPIKGLTPEEQKEIETFTVGICNKAMPLLYDFDSMAPPVIQNIIDILDSMNQKGLLKRIMASLPGQSRKNINIPEVMRKLTLVGEEYEYMMKLLVESPCDTCRRKSVPALKCNACEKVVIKCFKCGLLYKIWNNPKYLLMIAGGILALCVLFVVAIKVDSYTEKKQRDLEAAALCEEAPEEEKLIPAPPTPPKEKKKKKKHADKRDTSRHLRAGKPHKGDKENNKKHTRKK